MTIDVRKLSPSKQSHTNSGGDKAIIEEHGYRVRITIDIDYNRLTNRQIPFRHKAIHELVSGALDIATDLRGTTDALIDVDDLQLPIEMDTDHQ